MDIAAIPIAFAAGMLGVLSPCVWPLIPIIMGSSGTGYRGRILLAFGIALAFAFAGGLLTWLLISVGLDPVVYRSVSAYLLVLVGVVLISQILSDKVSLFLSRFTASINTTNSSFERNFGPFGLGFLMGLVWLPCVGPTLGAAIALASQGQDLLLASLIMMSFGLSTAIVLILAAAGLNQVLQDWCPGAFSAIASYGKKLLGALLIFLGTIVITGWDLKFQAFILPLLPDWVYL